MVFLSVRFCKKRPSLYKSSLKTQHNATEKKKMTATAKDKARQEKEAEEIGPAY